MDQTTSQAFLNSPFASPNIVYQPPMSSFGVFSLPVDKIPAERAAFHGPPGRVYYSYADSNFRPVRTAYSQNFIPDPSYGSQYSFRSSQNPYYLSNDRYLPESWGYDQDMAFIYSKYKPLVSYKTSIPPARTPIEEVLYYLKEVIFHNKEIEKIKELLARQGDFRISELFELFDSNQTGQIVLGELKMGLMKFFEMVTREEDLYLLVRRMSRDGNDKLGFEEFKDLFLPRSRNYPANILDNPRTVRREISSETFLYIARLFKAYLNAENGLEYIRKIIAQKSINLEAIFNKIDASGRGELLTEDEILRFLNYFEIYPNSSELEGLMARFDRNGSRKVSKGEFIYELQQKIK